MSKYTMPPRQKMINLLYVILIAMLAINVSSDVLEGYKLMDKDLEARINNTKAYTDTLRMQIAGKAGLAEALTDISTRTDEMLCMIDSLREAVAEYADKDDYKPGELKAIDDLNAVPGVFLSATDGAGKDFRIALAAYRDDMAAYVADSARRNYAASFLPLTSSIKGMSWERETFSYLSAIGGVMMLNRLEEAVLMTSVEAYEALLNQGVGGAGHYVLINENQRVVDDNGLFDVPVVLVSPSVTKTLYAGITNELSIFCAGIPLDELIFTTSGGSVSRDGGMCLITPANGQKTMTLKIDCVREGRQVHLCDYDYSIKPLPDPSPFLSYKGADGNVHRYYGGVPIRKADLQNIVAIGAEVNEGPEMQFVVRSFDTVSIKSGKDGDITSLHSSTGKLTAAQKDQIDKLSSGDKFYVTSIVVESSRGGSKQVSPINMVVF